MSLEGSAFDLTPPSEDEQAALRSERAEMAMQLRDNPLVVAFFADMRRDALEGMTALDPFDEKQRSEFIRLQAIVAVIDNFWGDVQTAEVLANPKSQGTAAQA